MTFTITGLTKSQWVSVVKNSLISGLVAFLLSLQVTGINKPGIDSAVLAASVAVVKIIEKLFTPNPVVVEPTVITPEPVVGA